MKKLLGIIVFFLIFNTLPVSSEINKKEENLKQLEFVFCKYSNHRQNKTQRNFYKMFILILRKKDVFIE